MPTDDLGVMHDTTIESGALMTRWTLGINTCFAVKRWPQPQEWAAVVADELGLSLVQHSLDLVDLGLPDVVAQGQILQAVCRDKGLHLDSTFTGLIAYSSNMLLDPREPVRLSWERWLGRAIDFTAEAGGAFTGGHVGAYSIADWASPDLRADRWGNLRRALERLTRQARRAGLSGIYLENLAAAREPATMAQIEDLLEDGDGEHAPVRLCLDVGHHCVPGTSGEERDPYAWLSRFGARLGCLHLQQTDAEGDHHWPFVERYNLRGRIDADAVLRTLERSGANEVKLFLEIIPPSEQDDREALQDLIRSVDHWRDALRRQGRRST